MNNHKPLLLYQFPVQSSDKAHVKFDLLSQEYEAIGKVIVQWSLLEHSLRLTNEGLCIAINKSLLPDASSFSFTKRLKAFRSIVDILPHSQLKIDLETLCSKIANAEGKRHKLAHGIWEYNPTSPAMIWSTSVKHTKPVPFDAATLEKLAIEIGELAFELMYPEGYTIADCLRDNGDETEDGKFVYNGISRRHLMK